MRRLQCTTEKDQGQAGMEGKAFVFVREVQTSHTRYHLGDFRS